MSDEARIITDDMLLSELTVGEFKQLMQSLLAGGTSTTNEPILESKIEAPVTMRRKSLDEFMSDLNETN